MNGYGLRSKETCTIQYVDILWILWGNIKKNSARSFVHCETESLLLNKEIAVLHLEHRSREITANQIARDDHNAITSDSPSKK